MLHGYLKVPYRRGAVQNQKVPTPAGEEAQAQAIAAEVAERMEPGRAYLLGPGTTTRAVAEHLGLPKTLVGVDLLTRDELLAADVAERQILEMQEQRPLGLILTPIGGQGFLLGRGNQQISPEVIRRVGRANLLVLCLPSKLAALQGRPLLVDTGDPEVDALLAGYVEVITGYRDTAVYRVAGGGEAGDDREPEPSRRLTVRSLTGEAGAGHRRGRRDRFRHGATLPRRRLAGHHPRPGCRRLPARPGRPARPARHARGRRVRPTGR